MFEEKKYATDSSKLWLHYLLGISVKLRDLEIIGVVL